MTRPPLRDAAFSASTSMGSTSPGLPSRRLMRPETMAVPPSTLIDEPPPSQLNQASTVIFVVGDQRSNYLQRKTLNRGDVF